MFPPGSSSFRLFSMGIFLPVGQHSLFWNREQFRHGCRREGVKFAHVHHVLAFEQVTSRQKIRAIQEWLQISGVPRVRG